MQIVLFEQMIKLENVVKPVGEMNSFFPIAVCRFSTRAVFC